MSQNSRHGPSLRQEEASETNTLLFILLLLLFILLLLLFILLLLILFILFLLLFILFLLEDKE